MGNKYHRDILNTIKLLNEAGLSIKIKAVITAPIFNIERISSFIEYFKQYENVDIVEITVPSHTLYKSQEEFYSYRLNPTHINLLQDLIKEQYDGCRKYFDLFLDVPEKTNTCQTQTFKDKQALFNRRSKCTGNLSSFIILPNGDVGLCEETYFNKNFILGNILNKSIMEVWSSPEAKDKFYIEQSIFPKASACSNCLEFEECRHNIGVCWTDAMAAYGEKNWLYPVPECPYAPAPIYDTKIW